MIDWARTAMELLVKEAIIIHLSHPFFNRDGDLQLPGCWMAALKSTGNRTDLNNVLGSPLLTVPVTELDGMQGYNDKCSH